MYNCSKKFCANTRNDKSFDSVRQVQVSVNNGFGRSRRKNGIVRGCHGDMACVFIVFFFWLLLPHSRSSALVSPFVLYGGNEQRRQRERSRYMLGMGKDITIRCHLKSYADNINKEKDWKSKGKRQIGSRRISTHRKSGKHRSTLP
jgi:hypothetical protein